ncbi:MAG: gluconokinase [Trueperaceae bacterium]|nr:gluconokinase [Trueperaceae bacterium]
MGVSGSGKTTVGAALAAHYGWTFVDADDFHGAVNQQKMAAGVPLDDDDRSPWLDRLRTLLDDALARGDGIVLACSALKRAYRERLGLPRPGVALLHLHGTREVLEERLRARSNHYMPPSLLASQLEALEPPDDAVILAIDASLDDVVARAIAALAPLGRQP